MDFALPIAITPVMPEKSLFLVAKPKQGFLNGLLDHFIPHPRNNYHPHIFSRNMTGLLSVLLVTAKIFTLAAVAWGPIAPAYSSAITQTNIISLTNESRQGYNIGMLSENSLLDTAAQSKANDMLTKGYFSHNTPDGHTPWDFINSAGYNYISAGENLAVNFTQAENVETAWMNSPGHRANILNKSYKDIGIGISQGTYQGHQVIFVVQMFGTLANQKIALNDVPTKVLSQTVPSPTLTATIAHQSPVLISGIEARVKGSSVTVSANLDGPAVKVLAVYGGQSVQGIMLSPGPNNTWTGELNLSSLAGSNSSVVLKVYDMAGNLQTSQVADFAGSTPANYNLAPQVKAASVTFGNLSFNPTATEQGFYLIFIAAILAGLILAIAIKRHIQHVSLVANGAFMIILAAILWVR